MTDHCPYTLQAHHIGLFCHDMEASINWWRENFDMRERRKRVNPLPDHGNSYMCQARVGGVYMELYDFGDIPQQTENNFWNTLGTKHVCFYPYNMTFQDAKKYLKSHGIRYEESTEQIRGENCNVIPAIWFYDLDGTRLELIDNFFPDGGFGDRSEAELFRTKSNGNGRLRLVLHHVAIYCRDVDEMSAWCERCIDLKRAWGSTELGYDGNTYRIILMRGCGYYLELHERPGFKPQPPEAYWGTLGTKHISLFTAEKNMLPLIADLKDKGCKFNVEHHWDEKYNHIPGGYTVAFFPTPDGTTIELNGTFWPGEGIYPGEPRFDD